MTFQNPLELPDPPLPGLGFGFNKIRIQNQIEKNEKWSKQLEISGLLSQLGDEKINNSFIKIINAFGSIKKVIFLLIEHATQSQLKNLCDILHHLLEFNDKSDNEEKSNSKRFLGCKCNFTSLPKLTISHIFSFLSKECITNNIKLINKYIGSICLNLMNSFQIKISQYGNNLLNTIDNNLSTHMHTGKMIDISVTHRIQHNKCHVLTKKMYMSSDTLNTIYE